LKVVNLLKGDRQVTVYNKPEITVIGDAALIIEGGGRKPIDGANVNDQHDPLVD
jgi:hypothetical protein